MRSIYLGLSSQELFVRLTEDCSTIAWRTTGSSKQEIGEVDLTQQVKTIKASGHQGLQFVGPDGKIVFDILADDAAKRDKWMVALNDLLSKWEAEPSSKPKSSISAAGESLSIDLQLCLLLLIYY